MPEVIKESEMVIFKDYISGGLAGKVFPGGSAMEFTGTSLTGRPCESGTILGFVSTKSGEPETLGKVGGRGRGSAPGLAFSFQLIR